MIHCSYFKLALSGWKHNRGLAKATGGTVRAYKLLNGRIFTITSHLYGCIKVRFRLKQQNGQIISRPPT